MSIWHNTHSCISNTSTSCISSISYPTISTNKRLPLGPLSKGNTPYILQHYMNLHLFQTPLFVQRFLSHKGWRIGIQSKNTIISHLSIIVSSEGKRIKTSSRGIEHISNKSRNNINTNSLLSNVRNECTTNVRNTCRTSTMNTLTTNNHRHNQIKGVG